MARLGFRLSPARAREGSLSISREAERRLLQVTVALGGFVPVGAGLAGALVGGQLTGEGGVGVDLDSQVRYLSGLLLGIGLAFWETIPQIELHRRRFALLTAIVALGGLMRLMGVLSVARPGSPMLFGLAMELVVTPLLCLWQARVARRFGT